ncbi:MAG: GTPase Era [Helicobacter sp.]|nr:GTPase Era [Helicobacter sp.]
MQTKCGFIGVVGNTNVGKSTLLNALAQSNLALVSRKRNATRKSQNIILMHEDSAFKSQIILVDTPGIHDAKKLLNKFMLKEALQVMQNCDLLLFIASIKDNLSHYEHFLTLTKKPHIIVLNKCDLSNGQEVLQKLSQYSAFQSHFLAIIPLSAKKIASNFSNHLNEAKDAKILLKTLSDALPISPLLFNEEYLSDLKMRDIYKEQIRQSLFENLSDELPYESDVIVSTVKEELILDRIFAKIYVQKESQKAIVIGKQGKTIARIGQNARLKIQELTQKKVFLQLDVLVKKGWSKKKDELKKFGYEV